jgi:hypothetical protein
MWRSRNTRFAAIATTMLSALGVDATLASPHKRTPRRGRAARLHTKPGRWALVQVWDGAVIASFDDEAGAREAMIRADDDEVVVLYLDT